MNKKILLILALLLISGLPTRVLATDFDGSKPLLCAVTETIECAPDGECLRGEAENIDIPPFLKINVKKRRISGTIEDGTVRTTEIKNVANLRIKETDRLAALAVELGRLGAQVEEREDGLTVHPPSKIVPAAIRTYNDHRMAMSFAVAGLVAEQIVIEDAACVSKSFPQFFDALDGLG